MVGTVQRVCNSFPSPQKSAGCSTCLQLVQSGEQKHSPHSLAPQFWTGADHAHFTNQVLALVVRDPFELALTERRKSSARLHRDQIEFGLIGAGAVIVHVHAHAIKHRLVQFLVRIQLCLLDTLLEREALWQRSWEQRHVKWMHQP